MRFNYDGSLESFVAYYRAILTDEIEDQSLEDTPIPIKSREEALQDFHSHYSKTEIWRLFVDGALYTINSNQGWLDYEAREGGALKACFQGLNLCTSNLEAPLTLDYLKTLHQTVTKNVTGEMIEGPRGNFRSKTPQFTLQPERNTPEGFLDLINEINKGPNGYLNGAYIQSALHGIFGAETVKNNDGKIIQISFADYLKENPSETMETLAAKLSTAPLVIYHAPPTESIEEALNRVINHYNEEIVKANTITNKLDIIGKTVQAFERIHPFCDANGRTFANLLLTRLLLQNGFPPATLFEPNLFDAFGYNAAVLARGILNTLEIYENRNLFNFSTAIEMADQLPTYLETYAEELAPFTKPVELKIKLQEILKKDEISDEDFAEFLQELYKVPDLFDQIYYLNYLNGKEKVGEDKIKPIYDNIVSKIIEFKNLHTYDNTERIAASTIIEWRLSSLAEMRGHPLSLNDSILSKEHIFLESYKLLNNINNFISDEIARLSNGSEKSISLQKLINMISDAQTRKQNPTTIIKYAVKHLDILCHHSRINPFATPKSEENWIKFKQEHSKAAEKVGGLGIFNTQPLKNSRVTNFKNYSLFYRGKKSENPQLEQIEILSKIKQ